MIQHLPLAYEPVALPCSLMKCGDVVHRSTLDLSLRGEDGGLDWRGLLLLASVGAYLFIPPGPAPGAVDYYITSKLYRKNMKNISRNDIVLGRKLATGGFGTVFRGTLKDKDQTDIIVKKAKEYGEAEVWMNERMMRVDGAVHCAELLAAFDERDDGGSTPGTSPLDTNIWLVWRYEGDSTLFDMMEKREFPYNLEPLLLGRELRLPKGPRRRLVTLKLAMKQLLQALACCHQTGIVHRDIKPQNCIVSRPQSSTGGKVGRIKLIDLGAAADLRIGINYVPKEYLLDPRYAPPQQYVMSTQTVRPPPLPVAAFLSPVLWAMEVPDRFDMYSAGVTMLQMAFPSLRNDNSIMAFNKKLQSLKYDLREWRRQEEKKGGKADVEGFELLDMEDGAGWDLLCWLMEFKPRNRPSAQDALAHPWFGGSRSMVQSGMASMRSTQKSVAAALAANANQLEDLLMTGKKDTLTEAFLAQELGLEEKAPVAARSASTTIAWWQERKSELRKLDAKADGSSSSAAAAASSSSSNGSSSNGAKPAGKKAAAAPAAKAAQADAPSGMKLPSWFALGKPAAPAPPAAAASKPVAPPPPAPKADIKASPPALLGGAMPLSGLFGVGKLAATAQPAGRIETPEVAEEEEEEVEEMEEVEDRELVSAKAGGQGGFRLPSFLSGFKRE